MDLQKEREAFERLPLAELAINCKYVFYNEKTNSYWPAEDYCPSDAPETMNFAWEAWQAAKAQAVPDGYVVASTKDLNIIYDQINDWNTDWPLVFGLFNRILEARGSAND